LLATAVVTDLWCVESKGVKAELRVISGGTLSVAADILAGPTRGRLFSTKFGRHPRRAANIYELSHCSRQRHRNRKS
ncbi:MAG TPA: hypothetical protein VN442_20155, partial [Bryobacteraceae bacterium]|nr:hypothetical protein [Bryobacteraceae bacterium]